MGVIRLLVASVALMAGLVTTASPTPAGGLLQPSAKAFDREQDCAEFVPEQVALPPTDDGSEVSIEVYVLLDRVAKADAMEAFELVADMYEPLDLKIVPTFHKAKDLESLSHASTQRLIAASKEYVGGERPEGFDVVFTFSSANVNNAAGQADCIGGVRFPDRAFAVGQYYSHETVEMGPLTLFPRMSAKVAAHEIGHLFGAHHWYMNCVEGDHSDPTDDVGAECTVMAPDLFFVSERFGTLEGAVVRGHALEYASD